MSTPDPDVAVLGRTDSPALQQEVAAALEGKAQRVAQLRKLSQWGSTVKCRKRLARGAGISKTDARSSLRLPAAQTCQPGGTQ